jgi:EAL domain-containing protein (putative c-di-GMP-specific phosphodiesterase class I)
VEALLRWQHPEHGIVGPDEFIPVAERCGLINQLGAWVMREACRQAVAWNRAGMPAITMAVNVATAQFRGSDVPRLVSEVLAETGLSPERLELEITETGVMQDMRDTADILGALSQIGVGLAIDDFGTGYSSLSYLRRLPVDRIKIDRSFVADVTNSEDAAVIARTIVTLARNLRLDVVAEGVETQAQEAFIRATGCTYAQGFLYGMPAEPARFFERNMVNTPTLAAG